MVKATLVRPPAGTVHVRIAPTALNVMVQVLPEIDTETPLVLSTVCAHIPEPTVAAEARSTRWGRVPVPTRTTLAQIIPNASHTGPRRPLRPREPYRQYVSILSVWSSGEVGYKGRRLPRFVRSLGGEGRDQEGQ